MFNMIPILSCVHTKQKQMTVNIQIVGNGSVQMLGKVALSQHLPHTSVPSSPVTWLLVFRMLNSLCELMCKDRRWMYLVLMDSGPLTVYLNKKGGFCHFLQKYVIFPEPLAKLIFLQTRQLCFIVWLVCTQRLRNRERCRSLTFLEDSAPHLTSFLFFFFYWMMFSDDSLGLISVLLRVGTLSDLSPIITKMSFIALLQLRSC